MGLVDMMAPLTSHWNKSSIRPIILRTKSWGYHLFKKGGAVTWIFGITFIMVGFPLVMQVSREQQLMELEKQQLQQGYGQVPQIGMTPVK